MGAKICIHVLLFFCCYSLMGLGGVGGLEIHIFVSHSHKLWMDVMYLYIQCFYFKDL